LTVLARLGITAISFSANTEVFAWVNFSPPDWTDNRQKENQLPLFKHEKYGPDYHQETHNIVPLEFFFQIENRKDTEDDQGDHFLNRFQLGGWELITSDPVGRHLKAILTECNQPAEKDYLWQRRLFEFEVPILGKGHENIRDS
jgi:hypothetical protein